jgi:hypothetical protein
MGWVEWLIIYNSVRRYSESTGAHSTHHGMVVELSHQREIFRIYPAVSTGSDTGRTTIPELVEGIEVWLETHLSTEKFPNLQR